MRRQRDNQWMKANRFPNITQEKIAVVRILSWYVTYERRDHINIQYILHCNCILVIQVGTNYTAQ